MTEAACPVVITGASACRALMMFQFGCTDGALAQRVSARWNLSGGHGESTIADPQRLEIHV